MTARPGAIVLARHGEPGLSRAVRFDARAYGEWWATYEETGLRPGQTPPAALVAVAQRVDVVLASTRRRSIETARAVAAEREVTIDAMFIEAPLPPPPFPTWMKASPRVWGFLARFWWWFFDNHRGQESRRTAEARAEATADRLEALAADGREVLLVAHGFFNAMVGRSLLRRGWRKTQDQGFKYWSMRRFEQS